MEVSLQSFRKRFTYDPQKDLLGKGGFGDVYKAYDNEDNIFVALKIAHASADDKYNLINEIKRFKKLNHTNIVKHIEAYEVNTGGFDIHGRPIINHVGVLEYADKGTLADFLKNRTQPEFRQITEDLFKDVIEGLAYLHTNNIIHRDLKPTNILLFSEGDKLRAKITDFGIAKRADATAASTQLVGTVEYMAPEYFTTGNITKASDIWSLGVMLLEALSGTHPFGKTTQGLSNEQIIRNILSKDITAYIQNINAPFKDLITRCLMREANLRPQTAEELKGLMQSSEDTFAERTQIISKKRKALETENKIAKWKRWGTAFFDFDIRKGRWKAILSREILIGLAIASMTLMTYIITLGYNEINGYRFKTRHGIDYLKLNEAINSIYKDLTIKNVIVPDITTFRTKYGNGHGYRKLICLLTYNQHTSKFQLQKYYYPTEVMDAYARECYIYDVYISYKEKGFKGTFKEFEELILTQDFLASVYSDYQKIGFQGEIVDFLKKLYTPEPEDKYQTKVISPDKIASFFLAITMLISIPMRLFLIVLAWSIKTFRNS